MFGGRVFAIRRASRTRFHPWQDHLESSFREGSTTSFQEGLGRRKFFLRIVTGSCSSRCLGKPSNGLYAVAYGVVTISRYRHRIALSKGDAASQWRIHATVQSQKSPHKPCNPKGGTWRLLYREIRTHPSPSVHAASQSSSVGKY